MNRTKLAMITFVLCCVSRAEFPFEKSVNSVLQKVFEISIQFDIINRYFIGETTHLVDLNCLVLCNYGFLNAILGLQLDTFIRRMICLFGLVRYGFDFRIWKPLLAFIGVFLCHIASVVFIVMKLICDNSVKDRSILLS